MKQVMGVAGLAGILFVLGCGGGGPKPTARCLVNSDCTANALFVCIQGYCVSPCASSRDCPSGERCIVSQPAGVSDAGTTTAVGTSCQPTEKAMCHLTSDCTIPLVCSGDLQCRNQCATDRDCAADQRCTSVTHLCADPLRDKNYDSAANEFTSTGGAGAGTGGASGGGGGAGHSDGGAGSGGTDAGGTGGAGAGGCTPTQFGTIAMGDANPRFISGVGVGTATHLFVFSGYRGPDPTADAGTDAAAPAEVDYVYAQSFDQATGTSAGAAAPLFTISNPPSLPYNLFVDDVAVAPTGEIALLFHTDDGNFDNRLYASFLTTAGAADAGVGVQVQRTVQVEGVPTFSRRVIWSVASHAFVASWKYSMTGWFARLRTFLPDGRGGNAVDVIPTPTPVESNIDDARVGTSGKLFGITTRAATTDLPYLTVLDTDGTQVGDFVPLSSNPVGAWAVTGGTTMAFVSLFISGPTAYGVVVPTAGDAIVLPDGGAASDGDASVDAADGGVPPPFSTFSFPSAAKTAQAISDDTGGLGGVGAVLLGPTGASFLYVTANGSKHMGPGTVISSNSGTEATISNYHGSFAISLYDGNTHVTQVAASACGP